MKLIFGILSLVLYFTPSFASVEKHIVVSMEVHGRNNAQEITVHYREAGQGSVGRPSVMFFHGARFSSDTWEQIGAIDAMAGAGAHAFAVDLPGFAKTTGAKLLRAEDKGKFVEALFTKLALGKVLIVAASMGGTYAIPFIAMAPERVAGYLPIAAGGLELAGHQLSRRKDLSMPVLVMWGDKDFPESQKAKTYSSVFPQSKKIVFKNAGHACYLDNPENFNSQATAFFNEVSQGVGLDQ